MTEEREVKRIEIAMCLTCPFLEDDDDGEPRCAQADRRLIPDRQLCDGGPPDWCPLRSADHLVTLRVK